MMPSRLPLNALHVFCVVVRHGGFRLAAQALHVTPGAVSKQIQMLEEHMRSTLFERTPGGMATLTTAGARLYERVANEMEAISDALSGTGRAPRRSTLLVDTGVTLAMYWLIPLLKQFSDRHPELQVQVRTTDGPINPAAPVDVFIRREPAELRKLPSTVFMVEQAILVCSPALQTRLPSRRPAGMRWLAKVPRIGTRSRPDLWSRWSQVHGLGGGVEPTLEYDNTVLAIQAALQGLGVLVVPEVFVAGMVESGALMLLAEERIETGTYSYAVGRRRDSARTSAFTEWLRQCGGAYGTYPEDRLPFRLA